MQRVRTEAGNEGEMSEVAIWNNNSYCGAKERMKTHAEFSIHRAIDNYTHTYAYIHIKGSEGMGDSAALQTRTARSHKSLPSSASCKETALPDFNAPVLRDIFVRASRIPFALSRDVLTSKLQASQRNAGRLDA